MPSESDYIVHCLSKSVEPGFEEDYDTLCGRTRRDFMNERHICRNGEEGIWPMAYLAPRFYEQRDGVTKDNSGDTSSICPECLKHEDLPLLLLAGV